MAKSSTRRVTIYINGKEVEASVKQPQKKTSHIANNHSQENSHEYPRPTATFSLFCIINQEKNSYLCPRKFPRKNQKNMPQSSTVNCQPSTAPSALHYHSALSLWLSVDPLSDKYPNLSPYAYCANNPVRLVDVDGREIGDYYDLNGKYLGWDGTENDNVHFISDHESVSYITERTRNKQTTPTSDVKIEYTTKYKYLQKAYSVYNQGKSDFGAFENGGAYDMNDVWQQGKGFKDHVQLSIPKGNATIHLHTWDIGEEAHGGYSAANIPSEKDLNAFKNFPQNIIVGMDAGSRDSFGRVTDRKPQICFYGNDGVRKEPSFTLKMPVVQKVVERGIRKGKL